MATMAWPGAPSAPQSVDASATIELIGGGGCTPALRQRLEQAGYAVRVWRDLASACAMLGPDHPACLLLDACPARLAEIARRGSLTACGVECPVIGFGGQLSVGSAVQLMKFGAVDVVQWPCADLLPRLHGVLEKGRAEWPWRRRRLMVRALFARLTSREREVLAAVMAGGSNKAIALDLHLGESSVETYRRRALRKLHASTLSAAMQLQAVLNSTSPITGQPVPLSHDGCSRIVINSRSS